MKNLKNVKFVKFVKDIKNKLKEINIKITLYNK